MTADIQDRDGAEPVVSKAMDKHPTLKKLWVDAGYSGPCAENLRTRFNLDVDVVRRSDDRSHGEWRQQGEAPPQGKRQFEVLPRRWVIERTNAWNDRCHRLAKDFEQRLDVSEAWIWLAEARMLLRRLGRTDQGGR